MIVRNPIGTQIVKTNQDNRYLDGILIDEDVITASPYEIAATLGKCDNPKPFPPFLIDFITSLFDCEIAEGNTDAIKKLCDGLEITLIEFFDTKEFRALEQEIQ